MENRDERSTHKVYEKERIGEVQIADEVVAIIAGLAATEVSGVDSMAGNITNELVGKLGMKNLSKGVKVDVTEEHVSVDLSLNMKYGYNIPEVSEKVAVMDFGIREPDSGYQDPHRNTMIPAMAITAPISFFHSNGDFSTPNMPNSSIP